MSTIASTGGGAPDTRSGGGSGGSTGGGGGSTGPSGGSSGASTGPAANDFRWSEGWRERLSAGDQATLQRLGRFTDPEAIWKSYNELERKVSSGEYRRSLPKDARPEEVQAFRKELGVPDKPEDYLGLIKFADGTVLGEDDKPRLKHFLEAAHAHNMPPAAVQAAIEAELVRAEEESVAQQTRDAELARATQDELRKDWPAHEYRANVNAVHSLLDQGPKVKMADGTEMSFKDYVLNARMPDGSLLGSSAFALKALAGWSREINPAATVVSTGNATPQAIDDEINGIKKLMGNRQSEYWKGPKAAGMQARYKQLLEAKEKLESRKRTVA